MNEIEVLDRKKPDVMDVDDGSAPVQDSAVEGGVIVEGQTNVDLERQLRDDGGPGNPKVKAGVMRGRNSGDADDFGDPDSGENDDQMNGKKKRHRRGKNKGGKHHRKNKWKPYTKMTWEERREVDERESKRACQKREKRFASGHPVAPYNTTQFLMEDHNGEQNLSLPLGGDDSASVNNENNNTRPSQVSRGEGSGSLDSSDEFYDSPDDEELFMEKEFTEAYQNIHAERLQTMNKNELIREYLDLESKVEGLESRMNSGGEKGCTVNNNDSQTNRSNSSITFENDRDSLLSKLEDEMTRLKEENTKLRVENENLKNKKLQT